MNRGAFRRFEFFETEVIAKDIAQQFVSNLSFVIVFPLLIPKNFFDRVQVQHVQ